MSAYFDRWAILTALRPRFPMFLPSRRTAAPYQDGDIEVFPTDPGLTGKEFHAGLPWRRDSLDVGYTFAVPYRGEDEGDILYQRLRSKCYNERASGRHAWSCSKDGDRVLVRREA